MRPASAGPRLVRTRNTFAAVFAATFAVISLTGSVWAEKGVTVVADGRPLYVKTRGEDIASALGAAGVGITDGDVVTPAPSEPVRDGMSVVVRHAIPVRVVLGEREVPVDVVGTTVADALVAVGVDPGSGAAVSPALDEGIRPGMRITVDDVFVRVVQEARQLPFETVTVSDPHLRPGSRETVTKGIPGRMVRVYRVLVTGGEEGERTLLAERVVQPPATEVTAVGAERRSTGPTSRGRGGKAAAAPGRGRSLTVLSTGYTPGCDGVDWTTATGARAGEGIVAVDPDVIPLGSRMYVPGYGYAVAADTGGVIRGRRIDLCFGSHGQAMAWGRRAVTIVVLP